MDKKRIDNFLKTEIQKLYYKSCDEYIIILKKCIDTKCNENRLNVYDEENAVYRANYMYVYDIIHKLNNNIHLKKVYDTKNKITYEQYQIINNNYNTNPYLIHADGIKYYKNRLRALYDDYEILEHMQYTGNYIQYDDYGQMIKEGKYINGNKIGNWLIYDTKNILTENEINLYQSIQLTCYKMVGQSIKSVEYYE
jgi:hypothetical protein